MIVKGIDIALNSSVASNYPYLFEYAVLEKHNSVHCRKYGTIFQVRQEP